MQVIARHIHDVDALGDIGAVNMEKVLNSRCSNVRSVKSFLGIDLLITKRYLYFFNLISRNCAYTIVPVYPPAISLT